MRLFLFCFVLSFSSAVLGQDLKSPSEFLGYELGTKFTRHHQVVDYYEYLAGADSERMQLYQYGQTYERRPLLLAYISSKENINNLEHIRQEHLRNTEGLGDPNKAIVWMSYNAHGNESASTEASMQTIYELLTEKSAYLENTVVLMDPCINPDGRDRYVNWYNQFGHAAQNVDPNSREHREPWLNGRPNHYMFDLNRDWAWLTQVESQQRIAMYNKWLPHVHVDFHEQGVDSPYYFAPAAEPFHEVITNFQREFQTIVGKNHAKYFDSNGWFYFTKEVYDLLYPSYGDTYPTYNGAIGMTYEQGGSGWAGLAITTNGGDTLTLKDRISHHLITGLSTLEVTSKYVDRLNQEFKKYYQPKNYDYHTYVLNGKHDNLVALTKLLEQHEIEFGVGHTDNVKGFNYSTGKNGSMQADTNSIVVSTQQKKGTLVKVLFEPDAKLSDSLTYDITAWSLPYAYGLQAIAVESMVPVKGRKSLQEFASSRKFKTSQITNEKNAYAFLTSWAGMEDAKFLADLLKAGIKVRYAKKPFIMDGTRYDRGTLIIARADNKHTADFLVELDAIAALHRKPLSATSTGFVKGGNDFGSDSVQLIDDVNVAVLSGEPTGTLQFGEIWHFFEQQLHYPLSTIDTEYFEQLDLSEYDVLILPDGEGYKKFMDKNILNDLKDWVKKGGKLIAMGGALKGLAGEKKGFQLNNKEIGQDSSLYLPVYDETRRQQIKKAITGAIFKAQVDNTHPLAYGYDETYFTLKLGNDAYSLLDEGTVVYLGEDDAKPVAGFAGSMAQEIIYETLIFGVENLGEGHIIYMVDNPLFRGFWENGKLFFANALFLVN